MDGCRTLTPAPLPCLLPASEPPPDFSGAMTRQQPTLEPAAPVTTASESCGHHSAADAAYSDMGPLSLDLRTEEVFSRRPGDLCSVPGQLQKPQKQQQQQQQSDRTSPQPARSCLRRARPARRCSDRGSIALRAAAAAAAAAPPRRRGSEAPVPPPLRLRRVHFPAAAVVTARIAAPEPRRPAAGPDVSEAYLAACAKHGAAPLPAVLRQLADPAVDALRLGGGGGGRRLSLAEVDSLEEVFRRRQWQRVDAADSGLSDEALAALLQIVSHYDATPWLSLAGAAPGRVGWTAVCAAVRAAGATTALQWLSLERSTPGEAAAAALGRSLRAGGLRVLHLERSRLHGRPLALLAAGLRHCTGLRQLYLGDNELGAGDGSLLAAALRHNATLQLLDLRNNLRDDDAAGYLLSGVAEQPAAADAGLLALNLWHNRLTAESAEPAAAVLATHPVLETLNLGRNALGDAAAARLAAALAGAGPLRRLGLQRCALGPAAAAALGCALADNGGLLRLDLRGNRLGVAGLQALLDGVTANVTLRELDLDMDQEPEPEPEPEPGQESVTGTEFGQEMGQHQEQLESGQEPDLTAETPGLAWERRCRRRSPERPDSGLASPADGDSAGLLLGLAADGGALCGSLDSTLGSSGESQSGSDAAADGALPSAGDGDGGGGGQIAALLSALSAACEANRARPPPPPPAAAPLPVAEYGPPAGHWLRRRLSAALRRVSLTCEMPARLPTPPSPPPAEERPRRRRLVSPSPSPSDSPLPSPTPGRSRFRVIRVSEVEPPPGTPPLPRGLLRPAARLPSPSPSCDGDDGQATGIRRELSPVPSPAPSPGLGLSPPDQFPTPRVSPRLAGRKFRITPVRETPGPA